jgi:hypothetical protein
MGLVVGPLVGAGVLLAALARLFSDDLQRVGAGLLIGFIWAGAPIIIANYIRLRREHDAANDWR